eukprot:scaffold90686_cov30-Phaeocystis_antarctica.AAC.1
MACIYVALVIRRSRGALGRRASGVRVLLASHRALSAWGDPRPRSGALQPQKPDHQILKSMPWHTFEDILPISLNLLKVSKAAAIRSALKCSKGGL